MKRFEILTCSWRGRALLAAVSAELLISALTSIPLPAEDLPQVSSDHVADMKAGAKLFTERVRSLLVQHCFDCHGGKETKADFSLASREELLSSDFLDLESPRESPLLDLIRHEQEPYMPLQQEQLADRDIAVITRWIELGAPYDRPLAQRSAKSSEMSMVVTRGHRDFWSFRPLANVAPPEVSDDQWSSWVRTPIDQFVLAKLSEQGIRPNRLADRRTLIRRAYLDLTGLPPTPQEVDQFTSDPDEHAYEKMIERLLGSEHYGERWARHWMDVARFAESGGFEHDADRPYAYHYRDFLIRAFNRDMPYDQFLAWQLAGDELAPDDPLAMRATGFIGAGVFPSQLTEAEFESARYDELDDIVTTTGVAFLGLSVGCARCHDHKFDPIPSVDYYRMVAAFTKTIRSHVDVPVDEDLLKRQRAEHRQKLEAAVKRRDQFERAELNQEFERYLKEAEPANLANAGPWRVLRPGDVKSNAGTKFKILDDDSVLSQGKAADAEVITWEAADSLKGIRAIRLEALTHDSFPGRGPGRAGNGNFALGNFEVWVQAAGEEQQPQVVKLVSASATHQQNTTSLSVAASLDDDPVSGWAVDAGGIGKDQAAAFVLDDSFQAPSGPATLTVRLTLNHPNRKHTLGRFRVSVSKQADAAAEVDDPKRISREVVSAIESLKSELGDENADARKIAWNWFKRQQPNWKKLDGDVQRIRQAEPANKEMVQVSSAGFAKIRHHADGRGYPHFYPQTHVLLRGDVNQKVEVAKPGFLQVLMPHGEQSERWRVEAREGWTRTSFDRASLANWMTDTDGGAGGLAARVIVNRLWQHHFGRGIVGTPNDFGLQGERPSHPELLDWLASELVRGGWKLKPIHQLIMSSGVYRQSSQADQSRMSIDGNNRFLWRQSPRRLEGEAIRDSILATSGLLDPTMYGPGSRNEMMRRRSVYFTIKRSGLIPSMMAFDWPEHLVSIGRRASTTVAPQALVFLNGPLTRHCAKTLANRVIQMDSEDQVANAYRAILGRIPNEKERELASRFLARQTELHRSAGATGAEVKSLADFCQTLYCMNEFIYVD